MASLTTDGLRSRAVRKGQTGLGSSPALSLPGCVTSAKLFPSLGLSWHICKMGTAPPSLPVAQGC